MQVHEQFKCINVCAVLITLLLTAIKKIKWVFCPPNSSANRLCLAHEKKKHNKCKTLTTAQHCLRKMASVSIFIVIESVTAICTCFSSLAKFWNFPLLSSFSLYWHFLCKAISPLFMLKSFHSKYIEKRN